MKKKYFFVNLKRFDVPKRYGGVCPADNSQDWVKEIVKKTADGGIADMNDIAIVYLVPEILINSAIESANGSKVRIGCQSVFRDDVSENGNFGAFTSNLPAAAAQNSGVEWSIIGHSEERKDKQELMSLCSQNQEEISDSIDKIINREALAALNRGINVLICIGESADQRGDGSFETQKIRIRKTLKGQIEQGLAGVESYLNSCEIVIGYEPVWAIGPGKTSPKSDYIEFVTLFIKETVKNLLGTELPVVYGGGLKESNTADISSVTSLDGGLVALTKFTPPIGFIPEEFDTIVKKYNGAN